MSKKKIQLVIQNITVEATENLPDISKYLHFVVIINKLGLVKWYQQILDAPSIALIRENSKDRYLEFNCQICGLSELADTGNHMIINGIEHLKKEHPEHWALVVFNEQ